MAYVDRARDLNNGSVSRDVVGVGRKDGNGARRGLILGLGDDNLAEVGGGSLSSGRGEKACCRESESCELHVVQFVMRGGCDESG